MSTINNVKDTYRSVIERLGCEMVHVADEGKHFKILIRRPDKNYERFVVASKTPSDVRFADNFKMNVRREMDLVSDPIKAPQQAQVAQTAMTQTDCDKQRCRGGCEQVLPIEQFPFRHNNPKNGRGKMCVTCKAKHSQYSGGSKRGDMAAKVQQIGVVRAQLEEKQALAAVQAIKMLDTLPEDVVKFFDVNKWAANKGLIDGSIDLRPTMEQARFWRGMLS